MKLVVTGVTRTGNLGGSAMLCAVEDVVAGKVEDFALASILPKQDRGQVGPDHARIIDSGYRYLLLIAVPLCILMWPFRKIGLVRRALARLPVLKDVAAADAVADLSGIAFVDGRGIPLLYYNVAVVLPALFFGTPVHKLSQAVGPFRTRLNVVLARWTLSRCASVAARGPVSLGHLKQLGIDRAEYRQDTSFALDIPAAVHELAIAELERHGLGDTARALVVCAPSAVVDMHCARAGIDMVSELSQALRKLDLAGLRVALLPHAADTGIRKNDDHAVARKIQGAARARGCELPILDPKGDPRLARAIVGCSSVFLASRFHSMIAALSQAVPTVTVGWSHKYAEAAEPFGMGRFTIDYAKLDSARLIAMIQDMLGERDRLHAAMREAAEQARISAIDGIGILLGRRAG